MQPTQRTRSGYTVESLNANALAVQALLASRVDRIPSAVVTSLVIDCNGHDLLNLRAPTNSEIQLDI